MFRAVSFTPAPDTSLSPQLALSILALCWVILGTGCSPSSSSSQAAPLTPQQKQDLMGTLEGMSGIQAAIPEFDLKNHPAATKPGLQEMEDVIRLRCQKDALRSDGMDLSYLSLYGPACPVHMVYDLKIQMRNGSEVRNVSWDYEVLDDSVRPLNSIDRLSLRGSQSTATQATSSGLSGQVQLRVSGSVHSPQLGDGLVDMTGSGSFSYDHGIVNIRNSTTARLRFSTFDAALTIDETRQNGRDARHYALNGVPLSEAEFRDLQARLPILLSPGSNRF